MPVLASDATSHHSVSPYPSLDPQKMKTPPMDTVLVQVGEQRALLRCWEPTGLSSGPAPGHKTSLINFKCDPFPAACVLPLLALILAEL